MAQSHPTSIPDKFWNTNFFGHPISNFFFSESRFPLHVFLRVAVDLEADDAPLQWWVSTVGLLGLILYWSQKRRASEDRQHCLWVLQAVLSKTTGQETISVVSRARVDAVDCDCDRIRGRDCPHVLEVHQDIDKAERRCGGQTCGAVSGMLVSCFHHLQCERVREYLHSQLVRLSSAIESRKGHWQNPNWHSSPKAVLQGPRRKRRLDPELRQHATSSVASGEQRDTREAVNSMAGLSSDAVYRFQMQDCRTMRSATKTQFVSLRSGSLSLSIDAARFRKPGEEYVLGMLASCSSSLGAPSVPHVPPSCCVCRPCAVGSIGGSKSQPISQHQIWCSLGRSGRTLAMLPWAKSLVLKELSSQNVRSIGLCELMSRCQADALVCKDGAKLCSHHATSCLRFSLAVSAWSSSVSCRVLVSHSGGPRMPRDSRSAEAKAKDEGLRADERRINIVIAKCCTAIRNHPSKARSIWDLLASVGITEQNYNVAEIQAEQSTTKRAQLKRKETMREQKEASQKEAQALAAKLGAVEPLSEELTYIHKLTIPQLRDILKSLAPTVLTIGALSQHARSLQKAGLLEILEYVTGFVPETPLYPSIVCRQALLRLLQRAARVRGDRALKLSLPPAWSLNGLFRLTSYAAGKVEVGHRFTLQRVEIDVQEIVQNKAALDSLTLDDLVINFNFSELKACISIQGEVQGLLLSTVFKSHTVVKDELEMVISPESVKKRKRNLKEEMEEKGSARVLRVAHHHLLQSWGQQSNWRSQRQFMATRWTWLNLWLLHGMMRVRCCHRPVIRQNASRSRGLTSLFAAWDAAVLMHSLFGRMLASHPRV